MERAMLSWCDLLFSLRDSSGLLIKPVSTRIDGISGDLSTIKAACSTLDLCRRVTLPMWLRTFWPTSRLDDSEAVIDKSSNTPASTLSLSPRLTLPVPPIRSERFSLSASQRAVSEVAPLSDRAYTAAPQ